MELTDEQFEELLGKMDAQTRQTHLLNMSMHKMIFNMAGIVMDASRMKWFTYVNQKGLEKDLAERYPEDAAGWFIEAKDYFGVLIDNSFLAINNQYLYVVFSSGIYGDNGASTPIDVSDFNILFRENGSIEITGFSITEAKKITGGNLVGGEDTIRFTLSFTGTPGGIETIEIMPKLNSIFDADGRAGSIQTTTGEVLLYS